MSSDSDKTSQHLFFPQWLELLSLNRSHTPPVYSIYLLPNKLPATSTPVCVIPGIINMWPPGWIWIGDPTRASDGFMAESPILFLHCWGMKDVRISLSPFYFVVTIHRPAELQWSLGHRNRGIKAKADSRVWGEGSREKTGYGVV